MSLRKPTLSKSSKALEFAEQGAAPSPSPAPEGETKRVNVNVSVEVHRALKARAAAEGLTISDLVKDWINDWLKK